MTKKSVFLRYLKTKYPKIKSCRILIPGKLLTNSEQSENTIDTTISLLDAEDYCGYVTAVLENVLLLIRDGYQPTIDRKTIIIHLITLTKALPTIVNMIQSRATKFIPYNSNTAYARKRLPVVSNQTNIASDSKLQLLVNKSYSDKVKGSTPLKTSTTRSKRTSTISQEKDYSSEVHAPVPKNKRKFLMNEACLAFYDYPNRSPKIQLVKFWYSKA